MADLVRYSVYGLCLESNAALPGLAPSADDNPSLTFRIESAQRFAPDPADVEWVEWYVSDWLDDATSEPGLVIHRSSASGAYTVRFAEGIDFLIDAGGATVTARCSPQCAISDVATILTGPILGFLLRLRGVVALHANAIDVGGRAVILAGDAAAGKSTTAAMFARLGYPVLTDDVAPLFLDSGTAWVYPGGTEVALRPDAVARLYGSADSLPKFSDTWDKRRFDLAASNAYASAPLPVRAVYLLTNHPAAAGAPCLLPVSAGEAMLELLANIYGNRLLHDELRVRELDTMHHIARTLPVKAAVTGGRSVPVERFCEVVLDDVRAS